ncbi:MAG: hypothetical protein M1823_002709 [Watsoniomyces obsoletus]|nr:MAG: hypothetical protein M1823_002709 [Watsoniomyces obsoletus]
MMEDRSEQDDLEFETQVPKALPFGPILKSHILHCSYGFWHNLYRSITPKARIIELTEPFLEYLREDGIVLPDDDPQPIWNDHDSGVYSEDRSEVSDDDDALLDPSEHFREIHDQIKQTISELGGSVAPKLNWSAPKDATWIAASNSMECRRPSDIYLLLKSSDFISHDLEHAFDDCVDLNEKDERNEQDATSSNDHSTQNGITYTLVLRKWVEMNPSVEFRCFVRGRKLLAICQRDLNHFDFLLPMMDQLRSRIQMFFDSKLVDTFPDADFVFDVYLPPPHKRVWLIDINPWAPRTDPLLFSWLELLRLEIPGMSDNEEELEDIDRVPSFVPELRLVKRDDPEAYGFTTPQYSAHKLPKDVVDASRAGPGPLREFADQWKEMLAQPHQTAQGEDSAED